MSAGVKQPSNWMGFDLFSEEDNKAIDWARWYADKHNVVPHVEPEKERLYFLIDKLAQVLDQKEQQTNG